MAIESTSSSSHSAFSANSGNQPLIRLNVESRGDAALMRERTTELLQMIGGEDAH